MATYRIFRGRTIDMMRSVYLKISTIISSSLDGAGYRRLSNSTPLGFGRGVDRYDDAVDLGRLLLDNAGGDLRILVRESSEEDGQQREALCGAPEERGDAHGRIGGGGGGSGGSDSNGGGGGAVARGPSSFLGRSLLVSPTPAFLGVIAAAAAAMPQPAPPNPGSPAAARLHSPQQQQQPGWLSLMPRMPAPGSASALPQRAALAPPLPPFDASHAAQRFAALATASRVPAKAAAAGRTSKPSETVTRMGDQADTASLVVRLGWGGSAGARKQQLAAAHELLKRVDEFFDSDGVAGCSPLDLVLWDAVPALLSAAQAPVRSIETLQAEAGTPAEVVEMADAALLLLARICSAGSALLTAAGWAVDDEAAATTTIGLPRPTYVHPGTGETSDEPPDIPAEVLATHPIIERCTATTLQNLLDESHWAVDVLLELPYLVSPFSLPSDDQLRWLARIRHHEPRNPIPGHELVEGIPQRSMALTVVDVMEVDNEADAAKDKYFSTTRQLVLGPWQGITGFRETEMDLDAPPGAHLESWYTCALAACSLLSTPTGRAGRGRILVLGLGGGAIPSFLSRHFPGLGVEAIEVDRSVAEAAETWFGLTCDPPITRGGRQQIGLPPEDPAKMPFRRPVAVRVTTAERFVATAVHDPERRYDCIIVDVYTRSEFPPALLTAEFFGSLAKLLRSSTGWLAVNAGVGGDRAAVERLVSEVMPSSVVLMDGTKGSEEGDYENAVVVGLSASPTTIARSIKEDFVSPSAWSERVSFTREEWPDAPQPPFSLVRTAIDGQAENVVRVFWGSPDEAAPVIDGTSSSEKPTLLDRNDPAFSVFD
ncbi:hypothetical protein HK405_003640 [Cladochytrium tenue]|nr:hypothetical protein HK405_003640 [Cladochytrium tenue]